MSKTHGHELTPEQLTKAKAILNCHMMAGTIKQDVDGEYIGKASDGEWVGFGDAFNMDGVLRYLFNCPNPENW